ncbi:MAG TPA: glycosyltransferase family A protein [Nitrososphaera sp.]|nr:glycosyltransferase family A protein [Nitrososphaera sp.]
MGLRVAVVIPARNEEGFIGKTLEALFNQHTKPIRVIVVNDGSADRTAGIASAAGAEVVDMPDRGFNVQGTPVLAGVINRGLARIEEGYNFEGPDDYVLILGADHILPPHYITAVLDAMSENKRLVLCSGVIEGERSIVPRGSGRVVRADFWKSIGFRYPENYGFETYLVLKAQQLGYEVKVLKNLKTSTLRKTGKNYKKNVYVSYGKSLKALGYSKLYSAARIGLVFLKNPRGGFHMLRGYFSKDVQTYDPELRSFLSSIQHQRIKRYVTNPIKALSETV